MENRPLINGWHDEEGAKEFIRFIRSRETADERGAAFMLYATDKSFSRHDLSRAIKLLGYEDGDWDKEPKP